MKEYHKIEGLFNRDVNGTRKVIMGSFRNIIVELLKDTTWIAQEKIDGTNIRIYWDGHVVKYNGRTNNAQLPPKLRDYLEATFKTPEAEQLFEQLFGEKEVYLFGEGYGPGIQKCGGRYRSDVGFILFDVQVNDYYLAQESVEEIAATFNVPAVKVVAEGTIQELVDYVKNGPISQHSIDNTLIMEGVVARPMVELRDQKNSRVIVKIKYEDLKDAIIQEDVVPAGMSPEFYYSTK